MRCRRAFRAQLPEFLPELVPITIDQVVLWSGLVESASGSSLICRPRHRRAIGLVLGASFAVVLPGNVAQAPSKRVWSEHGCEAAVASAWTASACRMGALVDRNPGHAHRASPWISTPIGASWQAMRAKVHRGGPGDLFRHPTTLRRNFMHRKLWRRYEAGRSTQIRKTT